MNAFQNKTKYIIVSFLFFAIVLVGFVFLCTDMEYNYNQQMARGFISRDAIFFDIDNLSYKEAVLISITLNPEDIDIDSLNFDTTPREAEDPDFKLVNSTDAVGNTCVESMLLSGNSSYFASLHNGRIRGVIYKGDVVLPPMISGRFFTEEECISDEPLAVIGNSYINQVYTRDDREYIQFKNREYEVIGKVGLVAESALDDIVFLNLGSLPSDEQLEGMFYIDGSDNNEVIFSDFESQAQELFGCGLNRRITPTAFIDVVSGGMYMKDYLKFLMLILGLITFANILIQSIKEKYIEIAVMKIQGISYKKIFVKTTMPYIKAFSIGIFFGCMLCFIITYMGVFSLPIKWLIMNGLKLLMSDFTLALLWISFVCFIEWKLDPKEVIQKL